MLLKAMTTILGTKSWKSMLLEKCFSAAGKATRELIQKHRAAHVDWRWEHLEEVMSSIVDVYQPMKTFFKPGAFQDEGGLIPKISKALALEWFAPFAEMLNVLCHAVGKEARWFEGCYCHSIEDQRWRKRRRGATTSVPSTCCWKGKRLPSLVMGHIRGVVARVMGASSMRYREALLAAPPHVSAKIRNLEAQAKTKWCSIVVEKFSYVEHIPRKAVAAFAPYCGFDKSQCKSSIREAFDEYNNIGERSQITWLSEHLFGGKSAVSRQLRCWADSPRKDLHHYREAFLELQDLVVLGEQKQ